MNCVWSFDSKELNFSLRGWAEPDGHDLVCLRINGESSWLTREDARRLGAMLIASSYGENIFTPSKEE